MENHGPGGGQEYLYQEVSAHLELFCPASLSGGPEKSHAIIE